MITLAAVGGVALVELGMALTPGPNMIHLASRAITQGRRAGLVSLSGTAVGFVCYLLAAAAGLSALFAAVPVAFTVVKLAGAAYLGYLAWGMLKPAGRSGLGTTAPTRWCADHRGDVRERSDHAGRGTGVGVSGRPAPRHDRPAVHGRWFARRFRTAHRPVPHPCLHLSQACMPVPPALL